MDSKEVEDMNLLHSDIFRMNKKTETVLEIVEIKLELDELPDLCLSELELEIEPLPNLDIRL